MRRLLNKLLAGLEIKYSGKASCSMCAVDIKRLQCDYILKDGFMFVVKMVRFQEDVGKDDTSDNVSYLTEDDHSQGEDLDADVQIFQLESTKELVNTMQPLESSHELQMATHVTNGKLTKGNMGNFTHLRGWEQIKKELRCMLDEQDMCCRAVVNKKDGITIEGQGSFQTASLCCQKRFFFKPQCMELPLTLLIEPIYPQIN